MKESEKVCMYLKVLCVIKSTNVEPMGLEVICLYECEHGVLD